MEVVGPHCSYFQRKTIFFQRFSAITFGYKAPQCKCSSNSEKRRCLCSGSHESNNGQTSSTICIETQGTVKLGSFKQDRSSLSLIFLVYTLNYLKGNMSNLNFEATLLIQYPSRNKNLIQSTINVKNYNEPPEKNP